MRCTVCAFPQVSEVDTLLASGTSIRGVARLYGLARSTVARHRQHVAPTSDRFGVIPGGGGPNGPADPLAEAFLLAERARTPRERLRALEQVRGASKLRLRGAEALDAEDHELLDGNIAAAEAAYRDAADFETTARALSGWREAILQRLDTVPAPEAIDVPVVMTLADGSRTHGAPGVWRVSPGEYFRGVPKRYRDPERFAVQRRIALTFNGPDRGPRDADLKVYDKEGALVWAKKRTTEGGA